MQQNEPVLFVQQHNQNLFEHKTKHAQSQTDQQNNRTKAPCIAFFGQIKHNKDHENAQSANAKVKAIFRKLRFSHFSLSVPNLSSAMPRAYAVARHHRLQTVGESTDCYPINQRNNQALVSPNLCATTRPNAHP